MALLEVSNGPASFGAGPKDLVFRLYTLDIARGPVLAYESYLSSLHLYWKAQFCRGLWFVCLADDGYGSGNYTFYVTSDFSSLPLAHAFAAPYTTYQTLQFAVCWNGLLNKFVVLLTANSLTTNYTYTFLCEADGGAWTQLPTTLSATNGTDRDITLAGTYGGVTHTNWGHRLVDSGGGLDWSAAGSGAGLYDTLAYFDDVPLQVIDGLSGETTLSSVPGTGSTSSNLHTDNSAFYRYGGGTYTTLEGVFVNVSGHTWEVTQAAAPHHTTLVSSAFSWDGGPFLYAAPYGWTNDVALIDHTGGYFDPGALVFSKSSGRAWSSQYRFPYGRWFASGGQPNYYIGDDPTPPSFWTAFAHAHELP
jgi:hypothetical protein